MYCWGNAALSLDWVECRRKICLFERVSRRLFIQPSSCHVRPLTWAPCWLNAVKKCISRKSAAAPFCFLMPRLFGVTLFRLNAIGYCVFRKSAKALIFVRLILRAAFCRGYTGWIAFAGFITFAVNLYYIWVHYYICAKFLLHLCGLLRQFLQLWLQGENQRCSIF